jgi:hypothetical protein
MSARWLWTGRIFLLGALVATSPLLTTRVAYAAEEDASLEMARERFQEGVKFFDQKQYDKARAAFLQAYALKHHPAVLLNLAQSELRSGHEADSAQHFSAYLREHKDASEEQRAAARDGLENAKKKVGEVVVDVRIPDADVYVDNELKGRAPLPGPLYFPPGTYSFEARKDGKVASSAVRATAGQSTVATLSFSAPGTPPPAPAAGPSPVDSHATPSPAMRDTGERGERPSFFAWPGTWVGGGLTLVAAGVGVGTGLAAKQNYDNANEVADVIKKAALRDMRQTSGICKTPPTPDYAAACQAWQDDKDKADRFKTFSIVGFVAAGVFAAGTVVLYLATTGGEASASASARPRISAQLVPVVSPTVRGLALTGNF